MVSARDPHFPGRAEIEGYGAGGFRFAGMSHKGSILALPSGIWGWAPTNANEIDEASLARVLELSGEIDLLLIGTGRDPVLLTKNVRELLSKAAIRVDTMPTGAAASTYNILLGEGRRIGAGLIASD